jgi:3',5'-cyclic AMP phosphodiesterase CpdA
MGSLRLAHFSDFHVRPGALGDVVRMRALVDRAIAAGAEHLLFGGDIVDRTNLAEAGALAAHLRRRGFFSTEGFSIVPGNHDVWPFGERAVAKGIVRWIRDARWALIPGLLPAQHRYERFARIFEPAFEGAVARSDDDAYPCFKRIGPLALGMLDTTSNVGIEHARGWFEPDEARWLSARLRRHRGPRALLMHHWPFDWSVLPDWVPIVPRWADVNFADVRRVQRWIARSGLDAVFCGHLHVDGSPRERAFARRIGETRVYCMGRSGAVHQDKGKRVFAYHLVDVSSDRVRVRIVYVNERDL